MNLMKRKTVASKYSPKPTKPFRRVGVLVLLVMLTVSTFGDTTAVLTAGLPETAAAADQTDTALTAQAAYDEVSSDTYQTPEYMATQNPKRSRPFLNTNPPATGFRDEKEFTILEIIPHDACSYFPYLIDWKTKEGYDNNVPIGYEGLMSVVRGDVLRIFHDDTIKALQMVESPTGTDPLRMFYTKAKWAGGKEPFLSSENDYAAYKVHMASSGPGTYYVGDWFRSNPDANDPVETTDGYFEFVGYDQVNFENDSSKPLVTQYHGLYYISTTYAKGFNGNKGINHRIMAIEREGTESRGDYYVTNPAYYWPADYSNSSWPNYYNVKNGTSQKIESQTDYNYNVTFAESSNGFYRADLSGSGVKDKASGGKYLDYLVELPKDNGEINKWNGNFAFLSSGGNLSVAKAKNNPDKGDYVRIASTIKDDKYTENNVSQGYFRLFQEEDKNTALPRYDVEFTNVDSTKPAFYYAAVPSDWNNPGCSFSFIHYSEISADAKGVYDVPFIYDGNLSSNPLDITRYDATVRAVKHNSGRYALTSTTSEKVDNQSVPVYSDNGNSLPKDYVRGITNIDFIAAAHTSNGKDVAHQAGVAYGGNGQATTQWGNSEWGGWVFRPVADASEMEVTKLEAVYKDTANSASNDKFKKGDRIWVYNQQYKQRYYGRDGFRNNELFKLLAYSSNPADTSVGFGTNKNGVGYNWNETPLWNLEKNSDAQELLKDFELPEGIGIKIVQRSFDKVLVADVTDADLIYISRSVGLQGMTQDLWNKTISGASERNGGIVLPRIEDGTFTKFGDNIVFNKNGDISEAVLFAIYDACIVKQNTALMMEYNNFVNQNSGTEPADNLAKLVFLMFAFDNGQKFQYFIDGYPERVEYFSKITKSDAAVTVWPTKPVAGQNETNYNINPDDYSATTVKLGEQTHNQWAREYFNKAKLPDGTELGEIRNYLGDYANLNMIDDSQTIMGLGEYGPNSLFQSMVTRSGYNLWTILQRRKAKTPSYKVILRPTADSHVEEIKVADGTIEYVLYANEFDEKSFEITFEACKDNSVPMEKVKLKSDTVTHQFEGGGLAGTSLSVVYSGGDEAYTINVRNGFEVPGTSPPQLNTGVQKKTVLINGTDANGIKGEELKVTVILRDIFSLN